MKIGPGYRKRRDGVPLRIEHANRQAMQTGSNLLIVTGEPLRANPGNFARQCLGISDGFVGQCNERPACEIGSKQVRREGSQQHLADARTIGFKLLAFLGKKIGRATPCLDQIRHHVIFQNAEMGGAAGGARQCTNDRASKRDQGRLQRQTCRKLHEQRRGQVPPTADRQQHALANQCRG